MSDFKTTYTPTMTKEELLEKEKAKTVRDMVYLNSQPGKLNEEDDYNCLVCKNRGFSYALEPDGLSLRAVACGCMERRKIIQSARNSGLGELLKKNLSDYRTDEKWQLDAKHMAVDYANNPDGWFVALGQPGSGKTLLCGIVATHLLKKGMMVELKSWPELVRECSAEWFGENESLKRYKDVEVLFLDDFLKQTKDTRSLHIAYEILNYRYNYRKPTIISGETVVQEMWALDEALTSRMLEMAGNHLLDIGKNPERNRRV